MIDIFHLSLLCEVKTQCTACLKGYKFRPNSLPKKVHFTPEPEGEATSGHRLFPPSVRRPSHQHMKLLSDLKLGTHRKGRDESSKTFSAQFGTFETLGWGSFPLSGWPRGQRQFYDNSENDDDVTLVISSISSLSMATIDDNPGTGRLIDKYIYQVVGRMIERCAGRIVFHSLPPNAIGQRIVDHWAYHQVLTWLITPSGLSIDRILQSMENTQQGEMVISGYKRLVAQTSYVIHAFESLRIYSTNMNCLFSGPKAY